MEIRSEKISSLIEYVLPTLAQCKSEAEFNTEAAQIAQDENLDVALIRAIGKGVLTDDFVASKPFIVRYLDQARDNKQLRDKRRATLAKLFGFVETEAVDPTLDEGTQEELLGKVLAITDTDTTNDTLTGLETYSAATPSETKTSRAKLTDEDKAFIRDYVAEGHDEDDKKIRRQDMVEMFEGTTIGQIAAITAWTKMKARRVIKTESTTSIDRPTDPTPPSPTTPEIDQTTVTNTAKVELTKEEKDLIRKYVEEGTDDEDKKNRRMEMSEKFKTGVRQIAAVTAWTKIRAQQTMAESVEKSFTDEEKAFIYEYIFEGIDDNDKALRYEEIAKMFSVEASKIHAVIDSFEEENILLDPTTTNQKSKRLRKTLKGGAHVEYDNPEKNRWREKMKEFILSRTTEGERAKMKVLCLPGKKWLEATQVFLEIGFKPENIHGIERDLQAREEFENTAFKLGCNAHFTDLMGFVRDSETPSFDVISLDFLGPFNKGTIKLLERLKPKKKQLLMTNFMGKREDTAQPFMRMTTNSAQAPIKNDVSDYVDPVSQMEKGFQVAKQVSENGGPTAITRNYLALTTSHAAGILTFNPRYAARIEAMRESHEDDKLRNVMEIVKNAIQVLGALDEELRRNGLPQEYRYCVCHYASWILHNSLLNLPIVVAAESYEYSSGVKGSNSKYVSDFLEIDRPTRKYRGLDSTSEFLLKAVETGTQNYFAGGRAFNYQAVHHPGGLVEMYLGNKLVSQVTMPALDSDRRTFRSILDGDVLFQRREQGPEVWERKKI